MTSPDPYVQGPFDAEHLYLQFGGWLPGNEQWTCGMRLARTPLGSINDDAPVSLLPGMVTALQALFTSAGMKTHVSAKLNFVKLNVIKIDGTYKSSTTYETVFPDVSGSSSGSHPNQIALAVTLETGYSRGPAHRGRVFWPMPAMTIGIDGLVTAADAQGAADEFKDGITAINAVSPDYKLHVFSRKNPGAAHRLITGCSVGRVLDTQRSRRRSLLEDYRVGA